jgi:hypothetical protein
MSAIISLETGLTVFQLRSKMHLKPDKYFAGRGRWARGPGVDVMITIFSDFCQFSAKILAFFSKTNVMIKFLQN